MTYLTTTLLVGMVAFTRYVAVVTAGDRKGPVLGYQKLCDRLCGGVRLMAVVVISDNAVEA